MEIHQSLKRIKRRKICKLQLKNLFPLLFLLLVSSASTYASTSSSIPTDADAQIQQQDDKVKITGIIKDVNNEPIIGVSITEKGTTNATTSDISGLFALDVSPNAILVISYIGFVTQEIKITNQTSLTITLNEDVKKLEEVVIVGYTSQKKINLTGAVSSIDFSKDKLSRPATTVSSILSGMSAGLNVMQTSSKPNSEGSSVLIRGVGTLNNSAPLILVDGMEMGLNEINPNDIASVSILKDAASCAIYGNRGANGVILVTTNRGQDGRINVSYSGKFSYNTPSKIIRQVTNYADYMEFINEAVENVNQAKRFTQSTIDEWREAAKNPNGTSDSGYPNYVTHPNTDWYDEVFNPKWMQEHTVTLTGAEQRTNYSLSGTFMDNPGVVAGSGMKKYYFRSDIESRVTNFLTVGMRAWGYHTDQQRNNIDDLFGLNMQKVTPGVYPYYNGMYGGAETSEEDGQVGNPVALLANNHGYYKQNKYFVNPYITVSFLKDFKFTTQLYYDNYSNNQKWIPSPFQQTYSFRRGIALNSPPTTETLTEYSVSDYRYNDRSWKTSTMLTYGHKFGKHDVGGLIGYEEFRKWGETLDVSKKGMSDISLPDFDAISTPKSISGSSFEYSSRSVFGRATYAYDSKYLFEINMRYDGSSRFSPDSRWGLFPSFSAGWRISEEAFMKNVNWLDNLKLRASWGKLGNNSIGNYEWQAIYGSGQNYIFGGQKTSGLAMTAFSNYALEWESTSLTNVGIDFGALNNHLTSTIDIYNKNTNGILYRPTLSTTLESFTSSYQNLAEVNNKGVEITVGWNDHIGEVQYGVSGNFSFNKNEVAKYKGSIIREWRTDGNGKPYYYNNIGDVTTGGDQRIAEGRMVNEFYMLNVYKGNGKAFNADGSVNPNGGPTGGMIRTEQDMQWLRAMTAAGYKFMPTQGIGKDKIWYGDFIYADSNGDGVYGNEEDRTFQNVSSTPKFYYGLQAQISWKGFDLSMAWAGAAGFKINYYTITQNSVNTVYGYGLGRDVAYDHYFYDPANPNDSRTNLTSANPRLILSKDGGQSMASSTWHLHNGDYIKLRNLTIGYTLPLKWVKKAYLQNARVYASGENLLTITSFKGLDPEMMSGDGYAPMRQFAFGVNLTF